MGEPLGIRNVRNFWIEGRADGSSGVSFGPRAADGGFELTIKMRDSGSVKEAVSIRGKMISGKLYLDFEFEDGTRHRIEGER